MNAPRELDCRQVGRGHVRGLRVGGADGLLAGGVGKAGLHTLTEHPTEQHPGEPRDSW